MSPKDILQLKVFGFPEYAGHAVSSIDYQEMTAHQLAYIHALCIKIAEETNKELEERFDADRAYLLTEFGKISVEDFNKKVEEEKAKILDQKGSKLKQAFNFFLEKHKPQDPDSN